MDNNLENVFGKCEKINTITWLTSVRNMGLFSGHFSYDQLVEESIKFQIGCEEYPYTVCDIEYYQGYESQVIENVVKIAEYNLKNNFITEKQAKNMEAEIKNKLLTRHRIS